MPTELMWAKTVYTQTVGKEEPFYESRCCLTSDDLFGGALPQGRGLRHHTRSLLHGVSFSSRPCL